MKLNLDLAQNQYLIPKHQKENMVMKILVIVTTTLMVMFLPVLSQAENVVLIGNPSVKTSTLSTKDVSKIFLGKKITWDDGTKIIIVLQKNKTTHSEFLREYIHKSPSMFAGYWQRQVFTGKVVEPISFNSDQAVIEYVIQTTGAVGYVSTSANLDKVKTISVK